ncbi:MULTISPECIES: hypothetical protein [Pseudoxanthomonas]|uniref:DUF2868 domain-containing protein n=1 Tax=Pseudoxanthomonas winnipegensis TaxID=2480810 RepID=A0AAW8GHI8_9GAMM|nr:MULTISPECIES: hypothetical protein [Pseudoxanthomonas]MDQ1120499.1 hypothetical protein [Pseudoxanthomonas winnipegensis]MDQ1133718.1 hypothetical protein [Pseudoxanthomonas winnipegensis]MDR6140041.1 hypothetical protein [Pseudoxanthomonas sp. SORGH_AS_0997]
MEGSPDLTQQAPVSAKQNEPALVKDLSFPSLAEAMARYTQGTDPNRAGRLERWSFAIGLFGAGIGMLLGSLLEGRIGLAFAATGLALEIGGILVAVVLQIKREWPNFRHPYAQHAAEMEHEFHYYQDIVQALRAFPREQRLQREAFIRNRRSNMHERLGLFTGGMERLGVLPLLLALYLQLKGWHWGDWTVLADITLIQGCLAFLLLLAYVMSWDLIRLRARVQSYEQLFAEANRQDAVAQLP